MLANKLLSCAGGEETLFSDEVFTSYTRTGTGADAVVTTGIDMTKGYMLWSKGRSTATDHAIYDSARGVTFDLASNSTAAQTTQTTGLKAVSATGHTVGSLAKMNSNGDRYVDWVFRKAVKFFDVVTYTATGNAERQIPHSLGVTPGFIIIKRTDSADHWMGWHRNNGVANTAISRLSLNLTNAANNIYEQTSHNATTFRPGYCRDVDGITGEFIAGRQYVAYLFAHDTSADGIIQCGSFTSSASALNVIIGWEPQFLLCKRTNGVGDWNLIDVSRGFQVDRSGATVGLQANLSASESPLGLFGPTATGFTHTNGDAGDTYIYLAIRRPNKPPTLGTQVYNAIARTGTGAAATVTGVGFAPDLSFQAARTAVGEPHSVFDRLRGDDKQLMSTSTSEEGSYSTRWFRFGVTMDGVQVGTSNNDTNGSGIQYINHFFKRAVGFHSEICYTGTGSNKTEIHDLGKAPDLMIVKSRSAAQDWNVWCNGLSGTEKLVLNSTAAKVTDSTAWNSTTPTSSVISLGTASGTNANTTTYVAYLFSNIAGIQSIGTYVGDGTSGRLINCGFTTGSRYVCIKALTATGSFLVADSVRGIVSGNDPYLALNSTAAEVTTEDWLDTSASGFLVNQVSASNANVNGVTYMYWSIA